MKEYTIERNNGRRINESTDTLEGHIKSHQYTLECGKSYENEKGNKKINLNPKTIKGLITNLNNAVNNSAANGYSNISYSLVN